MGTTFVTNAATVQTKGTFRGLVWLLSFRRVPVLNRTRKPVNCTLLVKETMNAKRLYSAGIVLLCLLLTSRVHAQQPQTYANDAEWKESEAPLPPPFDVNKLVIFDVPSSVSLVYGIDPATVSISKTDSLVRYVVVATSASGVRNIMYEALRCETGEFKIYARYSPSGKWDAVTTPQWRSVFDNMPSKHPLRLARAGACDAAAPVGSVRELVSKLKNPSRFLDQ